MVHLRCTYRARLAPPTHSPGRLAGRSSTPWRLPQPPTATKAWRDVDFRRRFDGCLSRRWDLGFKQSSLSRIARVLRHLGPRPYGSTALRGHRGPTDIRRQHHRDRHRLLPAGRHPRPRRTDNGGRGCGLTKPRGGRNILAPAPAGLSQGNIELLADGSVADPGVDPFDTRIARLQPHYSGSLAPGLQRSGRRRASRRYRAAGSSRRPRGRPTRSSRPPAMSRRPRRPRCRRRSWPERPHRRPRWCRAARRSHPLSAHPAVRIRHAALPRRQGARRRRSAL